MSNGILRERLIEEIREEYRKAREKHAPMRGTHEGYAVLLEEVDELWDLVREKEPRFVAMRREAIQIGAMALAFLLEVCEPHMIGYKQEDA